VEVLRGADMVFITAGMGGGTGTGAAPVVAQLAKEMGILTVAVITKPFPFEGRRRMQVALKGIEELSHHVDSLITIPNEKLLSVLGREISLQNAFRAANDVLLGAVQGIADLITRPGLINVDFADVRTVMSEMGMAMMGSGIGRGDDRAQAAAEAAISNPLLDDVNLQGACGILVNISAGTNFSMREFDEIGRTVEEFASDDATIVIGTVLDPDMQDEVRVTVVATGLNRSQAVRGSAGREREAPAQPVAVERSVRMVRNATTGAPEYGSAGPRSTFRVGTRAQRPGPDAGPGRDRDGDRQCRRGLPQHPGLPQAAGGLRDLARVRDGQRCAAGLPPPAAGRGLRGSATVSGPAGACRRTVGHTLSQGTVRPGICPDPYRFQTPSSRENEGKVTDTHKLLLIN
jgi:cell division protein FtsZ